MAEVVATEMRAPNPYVELLTGLALAVSSVRRRTLQVARLRRLAFSGALGAFLVQGFSPSGSKAFRVCVWVLGASSFRVNVEGFGYSMAQPALKPITHRLNRCTRCEPPR